MILHSIAVWNLLSAMFKGILKQPNNIYLSVGEEGVAVVYFIGNEIARKLFIRSTKDEDTIELRKILLGDQDAYIHIFIDVLDQTYIQRTLPAISVFNINKLAKQRLEKETIKTHLKSFIQVGRTPGGRHDWIFTFISTAFDPPLATWVKFFEEYNNIIYKIHFLPVELYIIVEKLKQSQKKQQGFRIKNIISFFNPVERGKLSLWEVVVTSNKSGGFRQVIFQNGKVIFTRLLNSLTDPNPEIIAGNIEQEIINSIEYLKRLTATQQYEIYINIIVSSEIKKSIRRGKFSAKEVRIYTPYEALSSMQLPESITKENDRFCDPLILSLMHYNKKRTITVHTPESGKVLLYTRIFESSLLALKLAIPIVAMLILVSIFHIFSLTEKMQYFKSQEREILSVITSKDTIKKAEEAKLGHKIAAQEIMEIVALYDKYTKYDTDPVQLLQQLAVIMPDLAKITHFQVNYSVPGLRHHESNAAIAMFATAHPGNKKFNFIADFTVHFTNFGSSYEDLKNNYDNYVRELKEVFGEYTVKISALPKKFTLSDLQKPFYLQLVIQTPVQKNMMVVR